MSRTKQTTEPRRTRLARLLRHSRPGYTPAEILASEQEAQELREQQQAREALNAEVNARRRQASERTYGPNFRFFERHIGRARAAAWAVHQGISVETTPSTEETDTGSGANTPRTNRSPISSEDLVRDATIALVNIGFAPTNVNLIGLPDILVPSHPVVSERLSLLRLRFDPSSVPSPEDYIGVVLIVAHSQYETSQRSELTELFPPVSEE